MPKKTIDDAFWSRVDKTGDCWTWKAFLDRKGYGLFIFKGKKIPAHRYSYMQLKGDIPEGFVIDHLCRNTSCVNPSHLEAVTNRENVRRGYEFLKSCGIFQSRLDGRRAAHCKNGHEFTQENVYLRPGGLSRACKTCRKEAAKRFQSRVAKGYWGNIRKRYKANRALRNQDMKPTPAS